MAERLIADELRLVNFRAFKDVVIQLGKNITVISGVNGVGKSNILSLISSGSGLNKKSQLGSNFQPEFTEFFNIDDSENFSEYRLFIRYVKEDGDYALARRLSFKDDRADNRGIRIIPRTTNYYTPTIKAGVVAQKDKRLYDVGGSARVKIPTIYTSLSRLYPLGEKPDSVKVNRLHRNNYFIQKNIMQKYREWYNHIIPGSIKSDAEVSIIKKQACARASFHMEMEQTPALSQSIGQDNIGNIVSALCDIYFLSLDSDYNGAILCIDEVDVSLHPDTQIKLLELLDQLSEELKIQIVVSTHSLTVLEECLKKEKKDDRKYRVVYLKNQSAPIVAERKAYELLKADMFGSLHFNKNRVKMYFEDEVGQELFHQLIDAFRFVISELDENGDEKTLRHPDSVRNYKELNTQVLQFKKIINITDNINEIVTHIGCDELVRISKADQYFKRVIIMLDGDARIDKQELKPKPKEFLDKRYSNKGVNARKLEKNIIFAPDYFAPETYLYRIIRSLYKKPLENSDFWRSMDEREETALYTSDKIRDYFKNLPNDLTNDSLKSAFGENMTGDIWDFIKKSDMLKYYYSDYRNVEELIGFIKDLDKAYNMCLPITISNRYA